MEIADKGEIKIIRYLLDKYQAELNGLIAECEESGQISGCDVSEETIASIRKNKEITHFLIAKI